MARVLLALSAVAVHAEIPPTCYDEYQCIYHQGKGSSLVSWDLRSLCSTSPYGYTAQKKNPDGTLDTSVIYFNVCGNLPTACAPQEIEGGVDPLYSRGTAVQFFEPECFKDPSGPNCPAPGQCCDVSSDPTCSSADPSTGIPALKVPCTGNCEVVTQAVVPVFLPITAGSFSISPGSAGINLTYPPVPAYGSDNYECPNNPVTNLPYERQLTISLLCDKNQKSGLGRITLTEPTTCSYLIQATTASACSSKGDPFDDPQRDAKNFGWVCLGAFLSLGTYFFYVFGDNKGWFDPVKKYIPDCPMPFGGRGGVYGGSYKTVSSSSTSSATATPISASAYGST